MNAEGPVQIVKPLTYLREHQLIAYFLKAIILVIALLIIATYGPLLPPVLMALTVAILSVISAIGITYHSVIKKVRRSYGLKKDGRLYRFNNGRILAFIGAFFFSASCFVTLFVSTPQWEFEWGLVFTAIALFPIIIHVMRKKLSKEYEPVLLTSRSIKWAIIILTIILSMIYICYGILGEPYHEPFMTLTSYYCNETQPFVHSSSQIVADLGSLYALVDGVKQFGAKYVFGYAFFSYIMGITCVYAIANLTSLAYTPLSELNTVFEEIETIRDYHNAVKQSPDITSPKRVIKDLTERIPIVKAHKETKPTNNPRQLKSIWIAIFALPMVLMISSIWLFTNESNLTNSNGYQNIQEFIKGPLNLTVFTLGDKTYDSEVVTNLYIETIAKIDKIKTEETDGLKKELTSTYARYETNASSLVEHYYESNHKFLSDASWTQGITESLRTNETKTVAEQDVQEQTREILTASINHDKLNEEYDEYKCKLVELKQELLREHEGYSLDSITVKEPEGWVIEIVNSPIEGVDASELGSLESIIDAAFRASGLPSDPENISHDETTMLDAILQTDFSKETANKLERFIGAHKIIFQENKNVIEIVKSKASEEWLNFEKTNFEIEQTQIDEYKYQLIETINSQKESEMACLNEYSFTELQKAIHALSPTVKYETYYKYLNDLAHPE